MAVMSVPGVIAPMALEDAVFSRDFVAMAGMTLMLVAAIWLSLRGRQTGRLGRRFGALMLTLWLAYNCLLAL